MTLLVITLTSTLVFSQRALTEFKKADSAFAVNNYSGALELYLRSLTAAEKEHNARVALLSNRGVGVCHYYLYDKQQALKWFYKYRQSLVDNNADSLLFDANYLIGVLYIENGIKDSAFKYMGQAIARMKAEKRYSRLSQAHGTLAEFHIQTTKNRNSILENLDFAEKYAEEANDTGMLAFAKMKQFNFHFYYTKNYREALALISEAEKLYDKLGNPESITNAYRAKAECLAMLGDTLAATYMNKWFMFKDSVFDVEKAKDVAHFETLYETEKKERLLQQQQQKLEKEKQLRNLYLVVSAALLVTIFMGALTLIQKNRLKTSKLLQEQNEQRIREIFAAEQKERIRIARDLHDSIGQKLAVMKMLLPEMEHTKTIADYLDETSKEVRSISHNLIPEILNFGLMKALEALSDRINSTEKVQVNLNAPKDFQIHINTEIELSIYRIVQEILSNMVQHAQATIINLSIEEMAGKLHIYLDDNGKGFKPTAIENSAGIGWNNIFTRVKLINGQFNITSSENQGSSFYLSIPIS